MEYLLALDLGTTSVKAALFESNGLCLASAQEEYPLITPAADQVELDPITYWNASKNTLRRVLAEAKVDPGAVVGLAVSSQGETLITLDASGQPIRNAIVWMDNRAVRQAEYLKSSLGSKVYDLTGIPDVVPTWPACKILWIKENEPGHFQRTAKFLLVQDYLIYRLTGKFVTDGSISCTTMLFDIIAHDWWRHALEVVGIDQSKLPFIQKAGSIAGKLTQEAARDLGLTTEISIICGGMDQSVGAIGAGNITEGVVSETTGAALTIQVSIQEPLIDPNKNTPVYVHSLNGRYLFVPVCPTAGMTFKWFKDVFIKPGFHLSIDEKINYYDLMNEMAEQVPPGSEGLVMLPHLMGAFSPVSNPFARGSFTGFTLRHGKGHFVRAIQEAVAFMLRQNIEAVQLAGVAVNEIRTTGGGSRSAIWNQIKADVCNLPIVKLENEDTALIGDAILAGMACGLFPSVEDACQKMVKKAFQVEPSQNAALYNQFYQRYCDLDAALKGFFQRNYST